MSLQSAESKGRIGALALSSLSGRASAASFEACLRHAPQDGGCRLGKAKRAHDNVRRVPDKTMLVSPLPNRTAPHRAHKIEKSDYRCRRPVVRTLGLTMPALP